MAVRIRMKMMGRKHRPFFRIVAIDHRQPRDGRVIEELGTYDPMVRNTDERVTLVPSRIKYWRSVGALPSEKVEVLLKKYMAKFEQLEADRAAAAGNPATVSPPPGSVGPPEETPPPNFTQLEDQIDTWLSERGFGHRHRYPHFSTGWSRVSDFWQPWDGELWCLGISPGRGLRFGVDARLLRAAIASFLGDRGTLEQFVSRARNNPDFPAPVQAIDTSFVENGRDYWGVQFDPTGGLTGVRALIAELVNAFAVFLRSGGESGTGTGTRPAPQPGVLFDRAEPMPDPAQTPHHGFGGLHSTAIVQIINDHLLPRGYRQVAHVGSYSWDHPIEDGSRAVYWKLSYHGRHDWRFGVRDELVRSNACLGRLVQQGAFEFRFHMPPDTNAVFHGFHVFDTPASLARVRAVLACL